MTRSGFLKRASSSGAGIDNGKVIKNIILRHNNYLSLVFTILRKIIRLVMIPLALTVSSNQPPPSNTANLAKTMFI
jgi:hypothetical protein